MTEIWTVFRFAFCSNDIDMMLNTLTDYQGNYSSQSKWSCKYWKLILFGLCTSTTVIAAADAVFGDGLEDWSFQLWVQERAYFFSEDVFLWTYQNLRNRTRELSTTYASTVTPKTVLFAVASTILNFASNMYIGTVRDLALVAAITVYFLVHCFMKDIEGTMETPQNDNEAVQADILARRQKLWKQYRELRIVFKAVNKMFETLFTLLHVDNLLLYGYFVSMSTDEESRVAIQYILYAANLAKSELTYFLAGRVAAKVMSPELS